MLRVVRARHGHRLILFWFLSQNSKTRTVAVMCSVAQDLGGDQGRAGTRWGDLARFREGLYGCLTACGRAFELTDSLLRTDGSARSLVDLSLAPEHRCGHGALYDGVTALGSRTGSCSTTSSPRWCTAAATSASPPRAARDRTIRRRLHDWAAAGVGQDMLRVALAGYDQIIGLQLDDLSMDGSITKAPAGQLAALPKGAGGPGTRRPPDSPTAAPAGEDGTGSTHAGRGPGNDGVAHDL